MELSNKKRYPTSAIIGFIDENDDLKDLGLKKAESMPSRWLFAVSTNPEDRSDEDPSLYKLDSAELEPPLLFKKRSSLVSKEEDRFSFGTINETEYVDISKMSEAPKKQIFAEYFTNITLAEVKLMCPAIDNPAKKSKNIVANSIYKWLYLYRKNKRRKLHQDGAYEVKFNYTNNETKEVNVNSSIAEKPSYHYLSLEKYKRIVPNIVHYFSYGFYNSNIHGANKTVLDNKLFKFPETAHCKVKCDTYNLNIVGAC